ncbi:NAD(P)-binding protein [Nostocoides sp. F2B08]|uniref:NAD(P)-binding protein n=1 Tax=Nostocoides sp. F2B08 TaxID=2653936 RepID=UPI0012636727|nr:FAD/NAD(P)-binding protein [Tetrasphaera sp. F2B08]KAB7741858.1 NAD(P)-binding protein [Tetrasphaera sp. F2B08]
MSGSSHSSGSAPRRRRPITRRQFLDGMAIGAAGLAAAAASPGMTGAQAAVMSRPIPPQPIPPGYYPPRSTGITGQPDGVIDGIVQIDGFPNPTDVHDASGGPGIKRPAFNTGETYDVVIVGAGVSGLAAAKYYRDRFGPDAKILLVDPLPDFGGHAHRNEFLTPNAATGSDVLMLRTGGAVNLDSPYTWSETSGAFLDVPPSDAALDILDYLGVDLTAFPSTSGPGTPTATYGLAGYLLFPREEWGSDSVQRVRGLPGESNTEAGWQAFVDRLPYSQAAKDAIVRIQTDTTTDWIALKHGPGMTPEQRVHLLTTISYKQWLMDYLGAPEEAIREYQRGSHSLLGAGAQVTSAVDNWLLERPGFSEALGLPDPTGLADNGFPGIGRTPQMGWRSGTNLPGSRAWPDGNASVARLLVSRLIPQTFPDGQPNVENVVTARCDYTRLDQSGSPVRLRLNSLVYRVIPGGARGGIAKVEYQDTRTGGTHFVHARHVIMACWHRVTAQVVQGLPRQQVEDLSYARKVPLIYARASLNNWQAFADSAVSSISPRGNSQLWDSINLTMGQRFGSVYGPTPNSPDQPAILNFNLVATGHDTTPQLGAYEVGRQKLLELSFEELEAGLYDMIDRTVNARGGDFDPERDVDEIMINRWNYGYAHELTSLWDPSLYGPYADQPQRRAIAPFRNITIANSDSQAFAYFHSAVQEGFRAVQDLPSR